MLRCVHQMEPHTGGPKSGRVPPRRFFRLSGSGRSDPTPV